MLAVSQVGPWGCPRFPHINMLIDCRNGICWCHQRDSSRVVDEKELADVLIQPVTVNDQERDVHEAVSETASNAARSV